MSRARAFLMMKSTPSDLSLPANAYTELTRILPFQSPAHIVLNWLLIFSAITVSLKVQNSVVTLFTIFFIATRQHALLVLVHDGIHGLLHPSRRINDFLGNWCISIAFLFPFFTYRLNHFKHHQNANSELDPDLLYKKGQWNFPKERMQFAWLLLKSVSILPNFIGRIQIWGAHLKAIPISFRQNPARLTSILFSYSLLFATLTYLGIWKIVLIYWILPMYSLLQLIVCLRELAEHYGLSNWNDLNITRNYQGPLWERILLTPLNVGFHLDHHLFPSVPWYNLPALNRELMKSPIYSMNSAQYDGFFGRKKPVIADLIQ